MLLLDSFGLGSVPLAWVLVAAWGTVLAGLVFRCPHASVDVVALAAAAEMGGVLSIFASDSENGLELCVEHLSDSASLSDCITLVWLHTTETFERSTATARPKLHARQHWRLEAL